MEIIRFIKRYFTGKTLILVMALLLPQLASAYDFKVNGLCYNFNGDGTSVTVTYENSYTGGTTYYGLSGNLVIPSTVTYNGATWNVTTIGDHTFYSCGNLTSVTIPNSVTEIGNSAFYNCQKLTSVTIPNSVTSIDNNVFSGCSGLISIIVDGENPKYDSRNNCNAIIETETNTLITGCMNTIIPNSVTSIGGGAFSGCNGLTSVTIPNSVTTIEQSAFESCSGLTSVTIPNSVTSIGNNAFYWCTGLTSVNIGNSVPSIPNACFYYCTGLTSVTIGNSVTEIGDRAFGECDLTLINVESGNTKYDSRNNCNAIIATETNTIVFGCKNTSFPTSVTSIGVRAFYGCRGLKQVNIPNTVTAIGEWAFAGTGLTSVTIHTIPNSVTSIPNYCFFGCNYLTSVTIPPSVTSIGVQAFYSCTGLTEVTIPNSVTSIGISAFGSNTNIASISLVGNGAWNRINNLPSISYIKEVNIGNDITSLGNFGFSPDVVNCYAETPPSCSSNTFSNYDGALHVPTTSIASYFMADYWQNFNNMINDLSKINLDITSASLSQRETLTLTATVTPGGDEVLWSTTNPWVAIVDENGVVTATGGGECDIYATLASSHDAAYAVCHIAVSYPEITLLLSEESLEMNVGDEQALTITITPDNTGLTPTWSSSNTSVASVNYNGVITAVGEGECYITATVLDQTVTCHVTVSGNVTLTLNIENAIMGASQMLTVYPSCSPDLPVELVVTSSDPSVALARVVNRTNAPSVGLKFFPEKGMALNLLEELGAPSESKDPALASEKAIMIVGVQNGTATITVTTADGKATPAVIELRVVDVDGDRTITASDITSLYNYILNGDYTYIATSDINGDGSITSSDITFLYNLILGN